ncbi:MAG: hypothetical protein M3016_03390 [Actinomycetota bacterium]|nr:hypothetical protein [Actinomycetota bacterium]
MTTIHRISIGALLAVALGTSAAPAWALPDANSGGSHVALQPVASTRAALEAAKASAPVSPPPTVVRVTAHSSGFDWADAGIGAAGGVALSIVCLGGALAVSQHRTGDTHHTPAVTS